MEDDLLSLIAKERGVTNCIILTHNIDFVFLQNLVMSALKKCGNPKITVFADTQCALDSYAYQNTYLTGLGSRFRVVPVSMEAGFRFHPKAILLNSKEKGVLFVGSGNLTFGGWRDNAEIWSQYDSGEDGPAVFNEFYLYLKQIGERLVLGNSVLSELDEAFDSVRMGWLHDIGSNTKKRLIGRAGFGKTLLEQMEEIANPNTEQNVQVCTPYFDADGEAVKKLASSFGPSELQIWIESGRTNLTPLARSKFPDVARIRRVQYVRNDLDGQARTPFLHAKFFAFEAGDMVQVFVGSANCSRAALTIPGKKGNAELLSVFQLPIAEFKEKFVDVLEFVEGEPLLEDLDQSIEESDEALGLHLLAARFSDGYLNLAYVSNIEVKILECVADRASCEIISQAPGFLVVKTSETPKCVYLTANINNELVSSNEMWVDEELALQTTASFRRITDIVKIKAELPDYGIGDWADVFDAFNSDIKYLPRNPIKNPTIVGLDRPNHSIEIKYGINDIYVENYDVRTQALGIERIFSTTIDLSLPQLFRHWLGVSIVEPLKAEIDVEPGVDDMPVDESSLSLKIPKISPVKPDSDAQKAAKRKRVEKVVTDGVSHVASDSFLAQRSPEQLGRDIRIYALLLTTGFANNYISKDVFLNATKEIWTALFFKRFSGSNSNGWIERRLALVDDRVAFERSMQSPKLAAALVGWMFSIPEAMGTEGAVFSLSRLLSIGRLPWLWTDFDNESVAAELNRMLKHTNISGEERIIFGRRWLEQVRLGKLLHVLDQLLENFTPAQLKDKISQNTVFKGELLWQGKNKRLCFASSTFERSDNRSVEVMTLQDGNLVKFLSESVIPVAAILNEIVFSSDAELVADIREEVGNYINYRSLEVVPSYRK